jgi:hypothetical protein
MPEDMPDIDTKSSADIGTGKNADPSPSPNGTYEKVQ